MHNFQWGFRAHRRCTDPSLVLTLVLEMASSCRSSCRNPDDGTWDPLVLICCDIIKAYPKDTAPPRVRAKCWNLRNVPKTTDAADSLRMVNWYAIFLVAVRSIDPGRFVAP